MQQMQSAIIDERKRLDAEMESEIELAAQLMEVAPLVMRAIREQMRDNRSADLSVPQFRALRFVGRHGGVSLSQVAEHLGLSPAATSRLVDGLVAHGYVERRASASDRRFVTIELLPPGAAILDETRRRTEQALAKTLAALPAQQQRAVAQALEPLRRLFSNEQAGAQADGEGMQASRQARDASDV